MRGVALRYAADVEQADDILQESFIRVFEQLSQYTDQGNLVGWIYRITVNTALQSYRKQKTMRAYHDDFGTEQESHAVNESIENLQMDALLAKIQELPNGFRIVFNLRAIDGYSHKEIAEMLNISEGTSKSQYARAKKQLQRMILEEQTNEINRLHGS